MTFATTLKKTVAFTVAAQLLVATQFATMAQAKMISTEAALAEQAATADRAQLLAELQRDDVRSELIRQGVDPSEVEARLAAMTDAEVRGMLDQFDAGSAGAGVVGTLGTIFIILLVTDLLCLTRLFNFTRCVR